MKSCVKGNLPNLIPSRIFILILKIFNLDHNCSKTPVQYTMNYELPIGAENYTAELDALDVKIMKHREFYLKNFPISCEVS